MTIPLNKSILIEDLVQQYPAAVGFLMKKGIVCIQCGEPVWGTLEEAAGRKNQGNIDEIVKELNEYLSEK